MHNNLKAASEMRLRQRRVKRYATVITCKTDVKFNFKFVLIKKGKMVLQDIRLNHITFTTICTCFRPLSFLIHYMTENITLLGLSESRQLLNVIKFAMACKLTRERSYFSQSCNNWVIVWKLGQLRFYNARDIWKRFQLALVLRLLQFWENFQISLVV